MRLSEHLLYLLRQQRQSLAAATELHANLETLEAQLAGFNPEAVIIVSERFPRASQVPPLNF